VRAVRLQQGGVPYYSRPVLNLNPNLNPNLCLGLPRFDGHDVEAVGKWTMSNRGKRYTKEFKEEAVRLLVTSDKPIRRLAQELGISDVALSSWKREALRNGDHPERAKPNGIQISRTVLEQENVRLKRENEMLRQQREILKKSLGILSNDPLQGGMP
jgi:transposase